MEDENIFLYAGFVDSIEDYKGSIGVYMYFWTLEPEIRTKLISSWKKTLNYLEEAHIELVEAFDDDDDIGSVVLISDEEAIEVKPAPDNVVPFKR